MRATALQVSVGAAAVALLSIGAVAPPAAAAGQNRLDLDHAVTDLAVGGGAVYALATTPSDGHPNGGTLLVLDATGSQLLASRPLGAHPAGLAADAKAAYVIDQGNARAGSLRKFLGDAEETRAVDGAPGAIAVDAEREIVYVGADGFLTDGSLQAFDANSLEPLGRVALGTHPAALTIDPASGDVFVVDSEDDTLTRVAADGLVVEETVAVDPNPVDVEFDPIGDRVLVVSAEADTLGAYSAGLDALASEPVDGDPASVTVDPSTGVIVVASNAAGSVTFLGTDLASIGRWDGLPAPRTVVARAGFVGAATLLPGGVVTGAAPAVATELAWTKATLALAKSPVKAGSKVELGVQLSPAHASGTVSFFDGEQLLGTAEVVDGVATLSTELARGEHALRAEFDGGALFAASVGGTLALTASATGTGPGTDPDPEPGTGSPGTPGEKPNGAKGDGSLASTGQDLQPMVIVAVVALLAIATGLILYRRRLRAAGETAVVDGDSEGAER